MIVERLTGSAENDADLASDILMYAVFGAGERSAAEFAELAGQAGLELVATRQALERCPRWNSAEEMTQRRLELRVAEPVAEPPQYGGYDALRRLGELGRALRAEQQPRAEAGHGQERRPVQRLWPGSSRSAALRTGSGATALTGPDSPVVVERAVIDVHQVVDAYPRLPLWPWPSLPPSPAENSG